MRPIGVGRIQHLGGFRTAFESRYDFRRYEGRNKTAGFLRTRLSC
jgi:hypothetical protein